MRADCAHFARVMGTKSLTDHRRQSRLTVRVWLVDAEVAAKLRRALAEVMRVDQRDQFKDVRVITLVKLDDLRPVDRLDGLLANHLSQWPERFQRVAIDRLRHHAQQQYGIAIGNQRVEPGGTGRTRRCNPEERGHGSRETTDVFVTQ